MKKDKMRLKKWVKESVFIILVVISLSGYSQKMGNIRVLTNPSKTTIIRLDTTLLKNNTNTRVKAGETTLKIWAPKRRYYEQKITIVPDSNIFVFKVLTFSEDYIAYRYDLRKHENKQFRMRFIPIALVAGVSILGITRIHKLNNEADESYEKAVEAKDIFDNAIAISDISIGRNNFNKYSEMYNDKVRSANITKLATISLVAIGTYLSWHFIKKSNKLEKPSYESKKLLSRMSVNYYKNEGINSLILTYNF